MDFWRVGKVNYHPFQYQIDWKRVLCEMTEKLEECKARYYLKRDLLRFQSRFDGDQGQQTETV